MRFQRLGLRDFKWIRTRAYRRYAGLGDFSYVEQWRTARKRRQKIHVPGLGFRGLGFRA